MLRSITLLLLSFVFHYGFSQQKEFERFMEALDSCKAHSRHVIYEDSVISKNNYELKWTHITGTYGGSPEYFCEGKEADTLFTDINLILFYPYPEHASSSVAEIIGDRYLVETFIYPEPRPTSAQHFIYVIRYFVIKEQ